MRSILIALLFTSTGYAAEHDIFFGKWGTDKQCAEDLIIPSGTKRAAPFDIRDDWLGQGDVWCRLNWSKVTQTDDKQSAVAQAICGEDDARNYRIKFDLTGEALKITWDLWHTNGPLMRCQS